jgi:hypothetical protein
MQRIATQLHAQVTQLQAQLTDISTRVGELSDEHVQRPLSPAANADAVTSSAMLLASPPPAELGADRRLSFRKAKPADSVCLVLG